MAIQVETERGNTDRFPVPLTQHKKKTAFLEDGALAVKKITKPELQGRTGFSGTQSVPS